MLCEDEAVSTCTPAHRQLTRSMNVESRSTIQRHELLSSPTPIDGTWKRCNSGIIIAAWFMEKTQTVWLSGLRCVRQNAACIQPQEDGRPLLTGCQHSARRIPSSNVIHKVVYYYYYSTTIWLHIGRCFLLPSHN